MYVDTNGDSVAYPCCRYFCSTAAESVADDDDGDYPD